MAQTIFADEVPANLDNNDGDPYSLGTRFEPLVAGQATHGRWYFSTTPATAPVQIAIYRDSDQQQLGSAVFPADRPQGWHQVAFDPPIALEALGQYRVVVWTPNRYVSTGAYFADSITRGDIFCPAVAGRFLVGPAMAFADQAFGTPSYWADFVFVPEGEDPEPEVHTTAGTGALTLGASAARSTSRPSTGSAALTATATAARTTARATTGRAGLAAGAAAARSTVRTTTGVARLLLDARGTQVRGGGGPRLVTVGRASRLTSVARPSAITTSTRG